MYSYVAYCLGIHSALSLPELPSAPHAPRDVTIRLGTIDKTRPEFAAIQNGHYLNHDEAYFRWDAVGSFLVQGGRDIIVEPTPGAEAELLRAGILGIVFATLLHQRGLFVLHASSVVCDGQALVFLGEKGAGKSTMAAALYGRGHPLMTDDVLALDIGRSGEVVALPAFPQFKLMPESAAGALGDDPAQLLRLGSVYDKLVRRAEERFTTQPVPLGRVYALEVGPTIALTPLPPREAALQLIANSIPGRYPALISHPNDARAHLARCVSLLDKVEVFRVSRPFSFEELSVVCQALESHCIDR
jgi:hypothetical protein